MPESNPASMNDEASGATSPRPFRVCENCRALTPTSLPHCADCGAPFIEEMIEYERRQREYHFFNTVLSRPVAVTYVIFAVNILIYLSMVVVAGEGYFGNLIRMNDIGTLIAFGAKTNLLLNGGEFFRLITPIFIHGGLLHLASNSYAIWTTGPLVERLYGKPRFFLLYLFSGIGGVIGSYLGGLSRSPDIPSVGASGAIFGLFGALFVIGYRHRDDLPADFGRSIRSAILPVIVINLVIGLSVPSIDNGAHIGGLLTGAVLVFVLPYLPPGRERDRPAVRLIMAVCLLFTVSSFVSAWLVRGPHLNRRVSAVGQFLDGLEAVDETLVTIMRELPRNPEQSSQQAARLKEALAGLEARPGPDAVAESCRKRLIGSARNALRLLDSPDSTTDVDQWKAIADEVLTARTEKVDWVQREGGRYGFRIAQKPVGE